MTHDTTDTSTNTTNTTTNTTNTTTNTTTTTATTRAATSDEFGLRSLDIERLRAKRGAKWGARDARYSAWVADMDFPVAPAIVDALRAVIDGDEFGYPNWGGPFAASPAAELFAPRMSDRFGWEPDPGRVHDMIDVIQGMRSSVHHLSSPGDGVVLHMPSYHPFIDTIDEMDRRLVQVERAGDEFDYDDLERRLSADPAKLWVLCHPHNPLGHVFQRDELERIANIADRFDLIVISDEIHADLVMPGHSHIPFESLDPEVSARTVTVTSASKAFNLAGLRWAVLHAGNDAMHEALCALPGHYLGAPNVMAVTATVAAWTEGDAWLDAVIDVVDENRHALTGLLDRHLPGVVYEPPSATYLAWVDCRALELGEDPAEIFRSRGVELSPGPQFGPQGLGHVRINLATSPDVLAATVEAMAG